MMIAAGILLYGRYTAYMLFTEICERARGRVEEAEYRCIEIPGGIAIAEGAVTHAGNDWTKISYFYCWDGAIYNKVIPYVNRDYPENAKVIVVYLIISGPGNCLVSGFYRNRFFACGVVGLIMSIIGVIGISKQEKKRGKCHGKKENRSR